MNCLSFSCNFLFPIFCRRTTSGSLFSLSPFFQSLCRHSPLILSRVSFREMFSWELSMVLNKRRKDGLQVTSGYELKLSSLFLLCKLNAREQNSKHNENTQSVLSLGICIDDHSLQIMNKSRFFLLRQTEWEKENEREKRPSGTRQQDMQRKCLLCTTPSLLLSSSSSSCLSSFFRLSW